MTTPAPPTTTFTLTLSRKATRYVLEALQMLENKWLEINHTSTDEDEQADYGNDALDLHGTRESIQSQAPLTDDEIICGRDAAWWDQSAYAKLAG